jgi:hypothetical protein
MQHAHVKRKENHMNRYIQEEFHSNPALLRRLMGEAHLERSRAIGAGLIWLLGRPKALFAWILAPRARIRPARWIERLG